MCDVLKEIYSNIYEENFNYDSLNHRIKLQKAIYILENSGISVGDYSFSWNKYGPYSLHLDSEAKKCSSEEKKDVVFSKEAISEFNRIKSYIKESTSAYTVERWIECITTIHYLLFVLKVSSDKVLDELTIRKPYLNDCNSNEKAYTIAQKIHVA